MASVSGVDKRVGGPDDDLAAVFDAAKRDLLIGGINRVSVQLGRQGRVELRLVDGGLYAKVPGAAKGRHVETAEIDPARNQVVVKFTGERHGREWGAPQTVDVRYETAAELDLSQPRSRTGNVRAALANVGDRVALGAEGGGVVFITRTAVHGQHKYSIESPQRNSGAVRGIQVSEKDGHLYGLVNKGEPPLDFGEVTGQAFTLADEVTPTRSVSSSQSPTPSPVSAPPVLTGAPVNRARPRGVAKVPTPTRSQAGLEQQTPSQAARGPVFEDWDLDPSPGRHHVTDAVDIAPQRLVHESRVRRILVTGPDESLDGPKTWEFTEEPGGDTMTLVRNGDTRDRTPGIPKESIQLDTRYGGPVHDTVAYASSGLHFNTGETANVQLFDGLNREVPLPDTGKSCAHRIG